MSPSTVVTPIRLYPLHCTLHLCTLTLTRRHLQALVTLSHALVSDISFQISRCALHWLQLRKLLQLQISLGNPQILFFILFCWKVAEATTTLNFEHVCYIAFSHFSTLGSAHRFLLTVAVLTSLTRFYFLCHFFCPTTVVSVQTPAFVLNLAQKWLPFFVLPGTSPQQTFGFCQPFLNIQTWLATIWLPLPLQQQLLRLNFVPTMRRNLTSGSASSRPSLHRQGSDPQNSNTPTL